MDPLVTCLDCHHSRMDHPTKGSVTCVEDIEERVIIQWYITAESCHYFTRKRND